MATSLVVNEIYLSVQGESSWAGWPCVFVRLTGCPLRCSYCDTAYAFGEGRRMDLGGVVGEVERLAGGIAEGWVLGAGSESGSSPGWRGRLPLVELTGGEPLAQAGAFALMRELADRGFIVLLETSGAFDIRQVDNRVRRIVDVKCPGSGEVDRNRWENLEDLRATDEVKFVLGTVEDYEWARAVLERHRLAVRCPVLFSWVTPLLEGQRHPGLKAAPPGQTPLTRQELVGRILSDRLPVRFQVQMHKVIWPAETRGV